MSSEIFFQVRQLVSDYFDKNQNEIPSSLLQEREYIILTGVNILCAKWVPFFNGGSFAQSILDNKLEETFIRADEINKQVIHFYLLLLNNVPMPTSLSN